MMPLVALRWISGGCSEVGKVSGKVLMYRYGRTEVLLLDKKISTMVVALLIVSKHACLFNPTSTINLRSGLLYHTVVFFFL